MPIRGPKSFFTGLIFVLLSVAFAAGSLSINVGEAARMGPGYFPLMSSLALALLGIVLVVDGVLHKGEKLTGTNLRALVLVAGSVLAFALAVSPLGLVPAVAITSLLLSAANRDIRPVSSVVAALVLAGGCWLVFIVALRMPWPAFGTVFS